MELDVLMNVGNIPNNSTVYKVNGTKKYILKDEIVIGLEDKSVQKIKSESCKFLVSEEGYINAVSNDVILKWKTSLLELNCEFGDDEDE